MKLVMPIRLTWGKGRSMKKAICLLFACALCSVFVLTACSSSAGSSSSSNTSSSSASSSSAASSAGSGGSSSAASTGAAVTQADIEKMIVGTWVTADRGGRPELTEEKVVFNILSNTKARVSAQFELTPGGPLTWKDFWDADVVIDGNKVTITDHPGENATATSEMTISAISPDEFTANHEVVLTANGAEVGRMEDVARYVKVGADYGESILGTWEGQAPDNGQGFRCEYKNDGTYVFYLKDGDNWVASADTADEYYVAGNLLCHRWVENGQENREYWDIAINGDTMNWTAQRKGGDGNTFTDTRELKKIT